MPPPPADLLRQFFDAAIALAQSDLCIEFCLPEQPPGRVVVIGAGKASTVMACALEHHWQGEPGVCTLTGDTCDVDGIEEIADAVATPETLEGAWEQGINPHASLADNDGHGFFGALDHAGPTLTNVNNCRALLFLP